MAIRRASATLAPARIGVCGAGWWSQGWHLPHLHRNPDAVIAAIVEPAAHPRSSNASEVLETRAALGARYGAPTFESVDALLACPGLELDGLLVATPHASHFEIASKAMAADLDVLVEKPMTTNVAEARALAEAAARAPHRAFMVNNTANWRAQTREAHRLVSTGRIGEVEHVTCAMHSPLLWLFDDPKNEGWTQRSGSGSGSGSDGSGGSGGSPMVGNGFGWGQLSHLLAWVFKVTALSPVEAYCVTHASARSGADIHDAAVLKCSQAGGDRGNRGNGGGDCNGGNGGSAAAAAAALALEEKTGGKEEKAPPPLAFSASVVVSGSAALPGDAHGEAPVGKWVEVKIFGSEGVLTYRGDDQRPGSGGLTLRRRDGDHHRNTDPKPLPRSGAGDAAGGAAEAGEAGFAFENYDQDGLGPESLRAFVDTCRRRRRREGNGNNNGGGGGGEGREGEGDAAAAAAAAAAWVGCDAATGLATVRALDAMYRSAASGRPETAL